MDESSLRRRLFAAYQSALSDPDHQFSDPETQGLSGVFLPDVTAAYCASPVRLIVVGQETKAWNEAFAHYWPGDDFHQFMQRPRDAYAHWMTKAPGTIRFLQFQRALSKRAGGQALWANLFAVSHNKASPTGHGAFKKIQRLSAQLLRVQIDILQPHGILFTTGWRYDTYLRDCFNGRIQQSTVREPKVLWQFNLGDALCFRTSHPRYASHNHHRETAVTELLEHATRSGTHR